LILGPEIDCALASTGFFGKKTVKYASALFYVSSNNGKVTIMKINYDEISGRHKFEVVIRSLHEGLE
jgi:hypothetical protein